ncbi:M23 family metallopeptidase [Mollicutes bacterium LVI A0039]|nr:M23 family metallopeptidase [Mollicutes bacterium LVI A0039]
MMKTIIKIYTYISLLIILTLVPFMLMAGSGSTEDSNTSGNISIDIDIESGDFYLPMEGIYTTADYGIYFPFGFAEMHNGIDLDVEDTGNENVYSMSNGTVYSIENNIDGRGNCVYILHKSGSSYISTSYFHLSTINVKVGDKVDANTVIGLQGTTGYSTGKHLHLEVAPNMSPIPTVGEHQSKRVDPRRIFSFPTVGGYQDSRLMNNE